MNQEEISELIKKIRKDNNITQKQLADKYGVTYQAVSKWENAKSIPDIILLNKICQDYKVDFPGMIKDTKKNGIFNKYSVILVIIITILLVINVLIFIDYKKDDSFSFKTLSSNCNNFNISGSIAYNNNKSSIYISDINYCGGDDITEYRNIECILYEKNKDENIKIGENSYKGKNSIRLEDYLKDVTFNLNHYSDRCKHYKDNTLYLEVIASNDDNKTVNYRIPLKLNTNC